MMLFSLHSIFTQPTTIQTDNKLLKYVQKIKVCDFSIVDYFQYFGFKERHLANATFKELIGAILTHPKAEKHLIHFAESHYINDFAVLDSDDAIMFWAEKVKKSIENINVEIGIKNKKLEALNELDKVNNLLKVKEKQICMPTNHKQKMSAPAKEEKMRDSKVEVYDEGAVEEETEMTGITERPSAPQQAFQKRPQAALRFPSPKFIDDVNIGIFLTNIKPVSQNNQWTVGNRNMMKAWIIFKTKCAEQCLRGGISVADDIQSILPLSHIFYVKSNDNSKFMNEYYFGYKTLCTVQQYIKSKIGIVDKYTFKGSAQTEAIQVVENLLKRDTGKRKPAARQIINLAVDLPEDEYLIMSELVSMINYLPRRPASPDKVQHKLCLTDYANPVLRPIFEHVNAKTKLKWLNMESSEKKMSLEPNAVVYPLSAHPRCYLGIGKVTPVTGDEEEDRFKASADLISLAINSKAIIDDYLQTYVRDVVFFQIVGFKITFYIMSLLHEGMYVMTDIAEIEVPQSIEDLVSFATNLQASLTVSRIFKACCNNENKDAARKGYFRPTLSTPKFDQLLNLNKV
ncbi:hypothetical protein INT48_007234 [Thamnidium elegans]|uniref:Uncharacterized protein n=1 Tax=Thamnidium elegans TaxID=101142 RepID=A0A8H7VWV5_9FUNG|nr:hypothetical protein INT48_007234 [Thamnidium elegans]